MASILAALEEERKALEEERAALVAQADEEKTYKNVASRLDEVDEQLAEKAGDIQRAQAERKRIATAPAVLVEDSDGKAGPVTPLGPFRAMPASPSAQFLASDEWREYMGRIAPKGNISHKSRVESPKIDIEGGTLPWLRYGAEVITGGSASSAGAFVMPDQTGMFISLEQRLRIVDLLTRGTTDSNVVEYVRETDFTNNAASVAEGTNIALANEAGGGVSHKPWSELALERVNETVKTIAHGIPATNASLADAGQMRTYIDGRLRYGLALELERQVLNGDGSGEDFEGITEVANTQTQTFSGDAATTLRKAITKVELADAEPNGILLHPVDWEALDLFLTFEGPGSNYRQAAAMTGPTLWGLPVVTSRSVNEGSAIVADFRQAFLWDRQQTTIDATSGYMDFFMRNLVAIRAEMRAAFGVVRPEAFVIVDLGS